MDMKTGIYKITNLIDGKVYIGQTINYNRRVKAHIAKLKKQTHHNEHLQRAWNLYGEDSFSFEFILECSVSNLDKLEIAKIEEYDCVRTGYNLVDGGQKFRNFSPELRAKMSKALKGRVFSESHKRNISAAQKGKVIKKESIDKTRARKKANMSHVGQKNHNALISDKVAKRIIVELYENKPVQYLVLKYETTQDTIYNLMYNKSYTHIMQEIREAIKNRVQTNADGNAVKIVVMYSAGVSQNKIAQELNVSRNTIRRVLKSAGHDTKIHKNQYANTEVTNQTANG